MVGRPHVQRVEALVLKHNDWGEADRILLLYTRQLGKERAVAKGVRKISSRKAGHLEPFTEASLLLAKGHDLDIVTQAETLRVYAGLSGDLTRLGQAAYLAELVDRFTSEGEPNPALYRLLAEGLEQVAEAADTFAALRSFELHLLDLSGFRPELFHCVRCGAEIQARDQFFSLNQGGVLCPDCGPHVADARPVSVDTLRYLRHLARNPLQKGMRTKIPARVRPELETLLAADIAYLAERRLNALRFLDEVRGEGKAVSPPAMPPSQAD